MSDALVVPATAAHRSRVVDTVVAAFAADPAFRFFFPDDATYRALTARFAGYLFDKRLPRGGAWVVDGGSAVSLWDRPGPADPADPLDPSAPPVLDLPRDAQDRMDTWDATVHHLLPSSPHWYLGVLATDPARAGRGWGRAAMAHGLARAAAEGLPAYLETATESNVDLYRRWGWEVTGTEVVGPVTVRVMRHPAGDR